MFQPSRKRGNDRMDLKKKSRKELEEMAIEKAQELKKSEHENLVVGGYRVLFQLSHAVASKSYLKVWKKEHLIEIITKI
jgi:hypothetical protein